MLTYFAIALAFASRSALAFRPPSLGQPVRVIPIKSKLNGWTPDSSKPCYGLPGFVNNKDIFFDPFSVIKDLSLNESKRFRESEVMHSRVALMAVVGYLIGESTPTPFGITGPANDQLQQVPLPLFAALSFFIFLTEAFRAAKGWKEPTGITSDDTLFELRENYYPGDLGFDPLGLKPKSADGFATMQTKELNNGRLAMLAVAGFCAQELINHKAILPLQF